MSTEDVKTIEWVTDERLDGDVLSSNEDKVLERLVKICSEDEFAVLQYEYCDSALLAEKDGDSFIMWHAKKLERGV